MIPVPVNLSHFIPEILSLKTSINRKAEGTNTFYIQAIRDSREKRFECFFLRLSNGQPFIDKSSRGFMLRNNEVHIWNFETNQVFTFYYTKLSDYTYIRVLAIPMESYFICDKRILINNLTILICSIILMFICLIIVYIIHQKVKNMAKGRRRLKETIKDRGLKFEAFNLDKSIKHYRYSKSRKKSTNWEKEDNQYVHENESTKLVQVKSTSSEILIKSSSTIDTLVSKLASSEDKLENESEVNLNKLDSDVAIVKTNSSINDNESLISSSSVSSKTDKRTAKQAPQKSKSSKKPEKEKGSSSNKKEKGKPIKPEKVSLSNKKDKSKSEKPPKPDKINEKMKSTSKKVKTDKKEDKSGTLKPKKLSDDKSKKSDKKSSKVEKNKAEKSKNSSSKKSKLKTKPTDKDQSKKQGKSKMEKTSKSKKN